MQTGRSEIFSLTVLFFIRAHHTDSGTHSESEEVTAEITSDVKDVTLPELVLNPKQEPAEDDVGKIYGEVTLADGSPAKLAKIYARNDDGSGSVYALTGSDGKFTLTGLGEGLWEIWAHTNLILTDYLISEKMTVAIAFERKGFHRLGYQKVGLYRHKDKDGNTVYDLNRANPHHQ